MIDQVTEGLVNRRGLDDLIVVQHEHRVTGEGRESVEEAGQHNLDRRRAGRLEQCQRRGTNPWEHRIERGADV